METLKTISEFVSSGTMSQVMDMLKVFVKMVEMIAKMAAIFK
ncbi:hypothetical protein ACEN17_08850 [Corynebacterium rouxii]